tara:strand:- start:8438 stop:8602 length:165 start_codon:yes stop_codon:yes gene_type:complete
MKPGWIVFSAVAGFFLARILTKLDLREEKPNSWLATERLMQLSLIKASLVVSLI